MKIYKKEKKKSKWQKKIRKTEEQNAQKMKKKWVRK